MAFAGLFLPFESLPCGKAGGETSDSTITPIGHQTEHATWRRLPMVQETDQEKMAPGRDCYSCQGQVGIAVSCGIELMWMRMIKKRQMANLEREVLDAVESFHALATSACRLW